ncbi:hypothetical protein BBJ29_006250 [Phytophthora kernoviae]|uniref:Major facilitator superfamily (MFS) profile domain-containing protein n=1 Tax=Phytophthora kernoviae TaxID=325452 RepID=A0A3F2RH20_9STRA|nr:hypothetical protein BBJ29_006250 [Phytophthora kernoviae]RLN56418.1 hypothetical protein BBP00_00008020 [Phytophthora kernoviae]
MTVVVIDGLNAIPVPIAALSKILRKCVILTWGTFVIVLCCVGMTFSLVYSVGWLCGAPGHLRVRGAVRICITVKGLCTVAIGIAFPYIEEVITNYSFTPFLATIVLPIVFIYFMVPETSDLTIAEIQDGLRSDEVSTSKSRS